MTKADEPELSLVIGTYRQGGIDLVFESLAEQEFPHPWELVLADELWKKREKAVVKKAKSLDITLRYVRSGPYHYISNPETYNDGIRQARGGFVVIGSDYSYYPPNYLSQFFATSLMDDRFIPTACYLDHDAPADVSGADLLKAPITRFEDRMKFVQEWVTPEIGIVSDIQYALGLIGVARKHLWRVNSFDSCFSKARGYSDHELNNRLAKLGLIHVFDTRLILHRIARPHDNLKPPFLAKTELRTNDENREILKAKLEAVNSGRQSLDAHSGLEDRVWNHKSILLVGGGARFCTRAMVRVLRPRGVHVTDDEPGFVPYATDALWYGVSPGDVQAAANMKGRVRTWLWWTGTDCYNLVNGKFGLTPEQVIEAGARHLAVHDRLRDELAEVGIEAEVLLDVPDDNTEGTPALLEDPGVLVYDQSGHPMYMEEDTMKVIKAFPKTTFHFIGGKRTKPPAKNCVLHGWVDGKEKIEVYKQCIAYLTLVKHGGVSWTGIEMSRLGRSVITTWKGYHQWAYAKGARDSITILKKLFANPQLNKAAAKHYALYTTQFFYDEFTRIVMGREG